MKRMNIQAVAFATVVFFAVSCTSKKSELGSADNPIKMFFVPSVDVKAIEDNSKMVAEYLGKQTGLHYKVSIPTSYVAVIEALGTQRADIAALNTFGYILAHEKYGAKARLTVIRHGSPFYQAQFLARTDGPIKTVADIAGKKIAFVDPASASGYLLPLKILKDRNIIPREEVFAMRHDSVVSMIYQGQVDAGATFYSPPIDGKIQDARMLVRTQYPDVEQKIKIIELTEEIPNDPVVFRKDFPENLEKRVADALISFIRTPEGKDAFDKLYAITDLKEASDKDYDQTREVLRALGKSASGLVK